MYHDTQDIITVLVSGGLDSMACIDFFKKQEAGIKGIFIDFEQKAVQKEEISAKNIADHFGISLSVIRLHGLNQNISDDGCVRGRNVFLALIGLMNAEATTGSIALGIHSGTNYADCSPQFTKVVQDIFDMYTDRQFTINTPFLEWSKLDIWQYCKDNKLPIDLSYSCELGLEEPCGLCKSCKDRVELNAC